MGMEEGTTVVQPSVKQDMLTLQEKGLCFFMGHSDKPLCTRQPMTACHSTIVKQSG